MRTNDVALEVNPLYMEKSKEEQKENGDRDCGIIVVDL